MLKNIFYFFMIALFLSSCSKSEENADYVSLGSAYSREELIKMREEESKSFKKIKHIFKDNSYIKGDGKISVVIFSINNCEFCDELYEKMYENKKLLETLEDDFSSYHVLFSLEGKHKFFNEKKSFTSLELAEHFDINATPTLLFFDENGRELLAYEGYISPKRLLATLSFIKENSKLSEEEIATKITDYYRANKV